MLAFGSTACFSVKFSFPVSSSGKHERAQNDVWETKIVIYVLNAINKSQNRKVDAGFQDMQILASCHVTRNLVMSEGCCVAAGAENRTWCCSHSFSLL